MSSSSKLLPGIAAFSIFCSIPPYFLWHSSLVAVFNMLAGLSILILCFNQSRKSYAPPAVATMMLTIAYIWLCIINNVNIFGVLVTLAIIPIFFVSENRVKSIYSIFIKIVSFFLALSLIVYILVVFFGVSLPFTTIEPLNEDKTGVYYQYFMLIKQDNLISGNRFYGIFDEPGVVGTMCGVFLLIERFNLRRWYNIVLLLSGFFSFSLTFYFIAILYLLFALPVKLKIVLLFTMALLGVALYSNETVYELLFRRIEFNDGRMVGYNRTTKDFDYYYESFLRSSDVWFGRGAGVSSNIDDGGASYRHLIVDYGIVYFIFYVVSWGLYCIRKRYSLFKIALSIIVIFLVLYQRPFISNWLYVFLMVLVPCSVEDNLSLKITKRVNKELVYLNNK